jgi:hypothetical protein
MKDDGSGATRPQEAPAKIRSYARVEGVHTTPRSATRPGGWACARACHRIGLPGLPLGRGDLGLPSPTFFARSRSAPEAVAAMATTPPCPSPSRARCAVAVAGHRPVRPHSTYTTRMPSTQGWSARGELAAPSPRRSPASAGLQPGVGHGGQLASTQVHADCGALPEAGARCCGRGGGFGEKRSPFLQTPGRRRCGGHMVHPGELVLARIGKKPGALQARERTRPSSQADWAEASEPRIKDDAKRAGSRRTTAGGVGVSIPATSPPRSELPPPFTTGDAGRGATELGTS